MLLFSVVSNSAMVDSGTIWGIKYIKAFQNAKRRRMVTMNKVLKSLLAVGLMFQVLAVPVFASETDYVIEVTPTNETPINVNLNFSVSNGEIVVQGLGFDEDWNLRFEFATGEFITSGLQFMQWSATTTFPNAPQGSILRLLVLPRSYNGRDIVINSFSTSAVEGVHRVTCPRNPSMGGDVCNLVTGLHGLEQPEYIMVEFSVYQEHRGSDANVFEAGIIFEMTLYSSDDTGTGTTPPNGGGETGGGGGTGTTPPPTTPEPTPPTTTPEPTPTPVTPTAPDVVAPEIIDTVTNFLTANTSQNRVNVSIPVGATEAQILTELSSQLQGMRGLAEGATVTVSRQRNTTFHSNRVENVTVTISVNPTHVLTNQTIYFNTTTVLPQTSAVAVSTLLSGTILLASAVIAVKIKKNH